MSADKQQLKVLIVEDCLEDRERYRRLLTEDHDRAYLFLEAESGDEGLRLCWAEHPDCVLLDHMLPDMTGLDFLAQLGAAEEKSPIPVIMLTGHGDETVAVEAMRQGSPTTPRPRLTTSSHSSERNRPWSSR